MSSDESISIYQAIVKVGDGERRDVYEGDEVDEDGNDKAMRPGEASSTRRLNNRWNRLANGGNEFWMLLTRFMAALEFSRMVLPTIYGRKQQNLLTGGNIKKEGEVPPGIIFVKAGVFLREDAGRLLPEPVSTGNKDPVRIGFLENDKIGLGQTKEKFSHRCKRLLGGGTSLAGTAARRLLRGKVKRGAAIGSQTGKLPVSKQLIHEKSRPRGGALTAHYDLSVYEILNRLCNIQRLYLSGTKMLLSSKGLKRLQNLSKSKESRDPGTGDIVKAEKEKRTAHTLFTELSPDSEKRISGQEIGAAGADGVALTARNNSETASVEDQEGAPGDRDTFLRDSHDSYIKRKAKKYAKDLPFTERWPLNMQLYKKYLFHKRNLMGKKSDAKDEQKLAQKSLEKLKLAAEKGREIELKTENAPGIHQKGDPGAPAIKDDLPAAPPEKLKGPEVSKSNVPKVGVDTPPPTGLLGTTDRYGFFISGPETSDYPADFLEKMNAQTYLLHRKSKP